MAKLDDRGGEARAVQAISALTDLISSDERGARGCRCILNGEPSCSSAQTPQRHSAEARCTALQLHTLALASIDIQGPKSTPQSAARDRIRATRRPVNSHQTEPRWCVSPSSLTDSTVHTKSNWLFRTLLDHNVLLPTTHDPGCRLSKHTNHLPSTASLVHQSLAPSLARMSKLSLGNVANNAFPP